MKVVIPLKKRFVCLEELMCGMQLHITVEESPKALEALSRAKAENRSLTVAEMEGLQITLVIEGDAANLKEASARIRKVMSDGSAVDLGQGTG
jgi:hypothetical protein